MKKTIEFDIPEPFCDLTCPRQLTHTGSSCECGGAKEEWKARRSYIRENNGKTPEENGYKIFPAPKLAEETSGDKRGYLLWKK